MTLNIKEDDNEIEIYAPHRDGRQEAWNPDEQGRSTSGHTHAEEGKRGAEENGQEQRREADRSVTFQWESWPAIIGEAMPMLRLYWDTGGEIHGKELPMDPDLDYAMFIFRSGRLRINTARRDGLLIGLNSFNVGPTMYRKNTVTAIALILYVLPSERRGSMGYRFLKETDVGLAEMGVKLVQYVPGSTVDISPLLRRLGYKNHQGTWEKML